MHSVSLAEFERDIAAYDRAVLATPHIDHFCSSSDWVLPAHHGLMPPRTPWIRRHEDGFVALTRGDSPDGLRYLQPFEAAWGLASPIVGRHPEALVAPFVADCIQQRNDWDGLIVSGLLAGSVSFRLLAAGFASSGGFAVLLGPVARRYTASLAGGLEGFLQRRSHNFRRSVLRARRRARAAGISFEDVRPAAPDAADALYRRIMATEDRSWKGQARVGINNGAMFEFYRLMLPRLIAHHRLRLLFARHHDEDVGYILGAVMGTTYRGLQFSFDELYNSHSLGNVMQLEQIERLSREGISSYDLGSEADYKRRWAEGGLETVSLIVRQG